MRSQNRWAVQEVLPARPFRLKWWSRVRKNCTWIRQVVEPALRAEDWAQGHTDSHWSMLCSNEEVLSMKIAQIARSRNAVRLGSMGEPNA